MVLNNIGIDTENIRLTLKEETAMLLAADVGNTNITLGAYDSGLLSFTARAEKPEGEDLSGAYYG